MGDPLLFICKKFAHQKYKAKKFSINPIFHQNFSPKWTKNADQPINGSDQEEEKLVEAGSNWDQLEIHAKTQGNEVLSTQNDENGRNRRVRHGENGTECGGRNDQCAGLVQFSIKIMKYFPL